MLEARAHRADAVLLIVAALTQDELLALYGRALALQLDVLCEVHDAAELDRALVAGCDLIGVNNRNLHTFHVDLNTSFELVKRIPAGVIKVAESGINSTADIARLRDAGFDAFLIGESLMRAPQSRRRPARVASEFDGHRMNAQPSGRSAIWIKICATTNLDDALASIDAGANALGFIFAESPRQITPESAAEIIAALPPSVEKIGVVVNQTPRRLAELATQIGLTGVQLQGDESANQLPEYRRALGLRKIIKTLQARELLAAPDKLDDYLRNSKSIDGILLDSGSPSARGGTGVPFDWNAALPIVERIKQHVPVIIAGGLNPTNIADAIRLFDPCGVDVVSGVELSTGNKDAAKLRAFIAAPREPPRLAYRRNKTRRITNAIQHLMVNHDRIPAQS